MAVKISINNIALAGEFAVLSQLALHGFDANMTLGNTKGVDILCSHPESKKMRRIEVKTHYNNKEYYSKEWGNMVASWRMHEKHETIKDPDLFYCFVSIAHDTHSFNFYIVPSKIVATFVTKSHAHWLEGKPGRNDSPMRKFALGEQGKENKIGMPIAEKFLMNWNSLK